MCTKFSRVRSLRSEVILGFVRVFVVPCTSCKHGTTINRNTILRYISKMFWKNVFYDTTYISFYNIHSV